MDEQTSDDEGTADLTFHAVSPVNPDNLESITVDTRISGYGDYFDDDVVCNCDSQECVANFINDNFGCQICVSFQCNQGAVHACNPCDESIEPDNIDGVDPTVRR